MSRLTQEIKKELCRNLLEVSPLYQKAKEPGEVSHGSVEIPPEFRKLTYGQFYDLTHVDDKEDDQ